MSRDRFDAVSIANMEGKIALQEFLTLDIFPVAKVINTFILYAVHLTFEFFSELILVIICIDIHSNEKQFMEISFKHISIKKGIVIFCILSVK